MNSKKLGVYSIFLLMTIQLIPFILAQEEVGSWQEIIGANSFANVMLYIFGQPVAYEGINAVSAGIITVAVWLFFFITFSDIIATFSTFSKWVSWGAGLLIGVIAANMGFCVKGFAYVTGVFAFLGGLAVWFGIGTAFASFIAANLGLFFIKRAMMRQAMKREALTDEKGAKRVSSAITSLGESEKAFRGVGRE